MRYDIVIIISYYITLSAISFLILSCMTVCSFRMSTSAVRCGLYIILVLLKHGESCNISQVTSDWSLSELIHSIQTSFPDFSAKNELCSEIMFMLPVEVSVETPDEDGKQVREVIQFVNLLRDYKGQRNPLPRLTKLLQTNDSTHPSNLSLFLSHNGVIHLSNAVENNSSSSLFIENTLK